MLINKWNRETWRLKTKPHVSGSDSLFGVTARPLPLWQIWLPLIFFLFCLLTTCQICISGARPGGIRFKKDSLHIQKLILSPIPSLWNPLSVCGRRLWSSELWPLQSSLSLTVFFCRAAPFIRRISCQSCLSRSFKWARRPGQRFGDGLDSIF